MLAATVLGVYFAAAGVAPPAPRCFPVPVYKIPRGEVPRDVSSAPKITPPPPQVRPKG